MLKVLVKISESHYDRFDEVVEALSAKGFVLLKNLRTIGVVIGEYPDKTIEELEQIPGVSVVVEDRKEFRLQQEQPHITGRRNAKPAFANALFASEDQFGHGDNDAVRISMRELINRSTRYDTSVNHDSSNTYDAAHLLDKRTVTDGELSASLRKRYGS